MFTLASLTKTEQQLHKLQHPENINTQQQFIVSGTQLIDQEHVEIIIITIYGSIFCGGKW